MNKLPAYKKEKCETCDQNCTYTLTLSKGATATLKAIARFIRNKGINTVHPMKEMVKHGLLTPNQNNNLKCLTAHGLLAHVKEETGNYCMTTKGGRFLRGEEIPKIAIIDKRAKRQVGYYLGDQITITVKDFKTDDPYWEVMDFEIQEGRIIIDPPNQQPTSNPQPPLI